MKTQTPKQFCLTGDPFTTSQFSFNVLAFDNKHKSDLGSLLRAVWFDRFHIFRNLNRRKWLHVHLKPYGSEILIVRLDQWYQATSWWLRGRKTNIFHEFPKFKRTNLTRLRLSSHCLKIERGRGSRITSEKILSFQVRLLAEWFVPTWAVSAVVVVGDCSSESAGQSVYGSRTNFLGSFDPDR
jgi:hypothetical protein